MSSTLERRIGLLQATALNMSNMIGIGPFITIPLLMTALGGPQAMLGWVVALVIVIADGLIWSELGAAMPGSGGTYHYLREALRPRDVGPADGVPVHLAVPPERPAGDRLGLHRLCEVRALRVAGHDAGAVTCRDRAVVGVAEHRCCCTAGSTRSARLTVDALDRHAPDRRWPSSSPARSTSTGVAFDFPPARSASRSASSLGLGAAARIGVYDYLGYYDICYIGDEVKEPGTSSRASILISVVAVALIYLAINLSIIGVVPWREFVPADAHPSRTSSCRCSWSACTAPRVATRLHAAGPVDGVRLGVRAAARLLAHPVRRRARRQLLPRLRPAASDEALPARVARS